MTSVPGINLINKFRSRVINLPWRNQFWLDRTYHTTCCNIQSLWPVPIKKTKMVAAIVSGFVCAYHPVVMGSNPKHIIYAFMVQFCTIYYSKGRVLPTLKWQKTSEQFFKTWTIKKTAPKQQNCCNSKRRFVFSGKYFRFSFQRLSAKNFSSFVKQNAVFWIKGSFTRRQKRDVLH